MSIESKYTYDQIKDISDHILGRTKHRPHLGIICGSGLGGLADMLTDADEIDYTSIPNFPVSTVKGHSGKLVFGKLEGVTCVCMKGRFHFYEGYPIWKTAAPVQVMHLMGVKGLVVTNAAGGLGDHLKLGDLMLITDHINMVGITGTNPLIGPNDPRFGPRFPATNRTYSKELQELFKTAAGELGKSDVVKEGTYVFCSGPAYESCAEIRYLKMIGADAVGMSTVPETLLAAHCGMKVLGISLITNLSISDPNSAVTPNHLEVLETANMRAADLQNIIKLVVGRGMSTIMAQENAV